MAGQVLSARARKFLLLGLIGLPVVVGAVAWLRLRPFLANAEQFLAESLGAATGTHARVGTVSLDLWAGALRARGIELSAGERSLLRGGELSARFHTLDCLLGLGIRPSTLELHADELRLRPEDLQRLAAGGGGTAHLRLALARVALELPGHDVGLARVQLDTTDGTLVVRAERASWQRAGESLGEAAAEFRGSLSAEGAVKGRLRLEGLRSFGQTWVEPLELAVEVDRERALLSGALSFGSGNGALGFGLSLERSSGALELTLRPGALQLAEALSRLGVAAAGLQARLDGQLTLRRASADSDWLGPAELDVQDLRSAESMLAVPQLKAAAQLRLAAEGGELSQLRVGLPSGELQGSVRIGPQRELAGELRGEGVDLADLERLAGLAPAGKGRVELGLTGRWDAPQIAARLDLRQAALAGLSLGELNGELRWDQASGELAIERVELSSPERRLSARGASLRWDAEGLSAARARIQLGRLPLVELYRALGAADDPLLARFGALGAGSAELQVERVSGEQRLTLGLSMSLREPSLAGYRFDQGDLKASVSIPDATRGLGAGTIGLERLTLTAAGGRLQLAGALKRGTLDMRIDLGDLPLERLPGLGAPLTGRLDAHGSLRGAAASTRAGLSVSLRELVLAGRPLGSIQLQAELADSGELPSSACSAGRAALASGALGRASAWLICGRGFADHLQLDLALSNDEARLLRGRAVLSDFALASLLPPSATGAHLPGRLSAQLEFSGGGLAQPERLSGRLRVEALELGAGVSALRSKSAFELRVADGQLQLSGATLEGWGQSYRLSAAGSLGQTPRLIADGSIDSGMFTRDSQPLLAAFGELGVHVEWSPSESPALRGRGELRDVAVRAADTDVRKLRGQLTLHGDELRLERLTAELGGGQVTLGGALQLDGLRVASYRIDIQAAGVALEPQPLVQVTLDADTRLGWSGSETPKLTGRIKLKRALYGKQLHLDALAGLGSLKGGRAGRDRLLFDLMVEHEGPLRVRNSSIDGELALVGPERALHVLGSDQRLGVLGELAVTRGRLSFQGDQYNVTQGHVAFGDPQRIAPKFELRAVADRRKRPDAQIVLQASGTRDAFAIDVRCDAGPSKTTPAPFKCAYAGDQLRCDAWDHLVATYVCRTP